MHKSKTAILWANRNKKSEKMEKVKQK